MRKLCLAILVSGVYYFSYSQDIVSKLSKNYFRSDPFNGEVSTFLSHLINDPSLTNKVIEKKTDSSLFFFKGTYKTFNPFFFKPKRVEVVLNEVIIEQDSLPRDTIYNYQLIAYDDDTKEGVQELKKEFEKIIHRYQGSFYYNRLIENSGDSKLPGATYNFFDLRCAISPFAISWLGPTTGKEMCLVLTIRFDTYLNLAVLPMPFDAL